MSNASASCFKPTQQLFFCPRCRAIYVSTPAVISSKDRHTKICSDCGLIEGLEDTGWKPPYDGARYWTVDYHAGNEKEGRAP